MLLHEGEADALVVALHSASDFVYETEAENPSAPTFPTSLSFMASRADGDTDEDHAFASVRRSALAVVRSRQRHQARPLDHDLQAVPRERRRHHQAGAD